MSLGFIPDATICSYAHASVSVRFRANAIDTACSPQSSLNMSAWLQSFGEPVCSAMRK
jgi:hypothetical protein